ncbi:MAG: glycosyltransferase [Leptolyngbyaceae cyanobacterium]
MITVTLGTISFPFDRVVQWLEQLLDEKVVTEAIVFQHGATNPGVVSRHPLVRATPFLEFERLESLSRQSNLVISHAGQGSTRGLAAKKVPFVVIPRLASYGEHVDNHQLLFAQSVRPLGVQYCSSYEEIKRSVLNPPPAFRGPLLQGPRLVEYLMERYQTSEADSRQIAQRLETEEVDQAPVAAAPSQPAEQPLTMSSK